MSRAGYKQPPRPRVYRDWNSYVAPSKRTRGLNGYSLKRLEQLEAQVEELELKAKRWDDLLEARLTGDLVEMTGKEYRKLLERLALLDQLSRKELEMARKRLRQRKHS